MKGLIYELAIRVRTTRKLARMLIRDVTSRNLSANQQPDLQKISDFRKTRREELGPFGRVPFLLLPLPEGGGWRIWGGYPYRGLTRGEDVSLELNRDLARPVG